MSNLPAKQYLQNWGGSISGYLPANREANNFIKDAMILFESSDGIKQCLKTDAGKNSIDQAFRTAASTGLSLNPQKGQAAIIAFSGKASYQIMKNGMIELAMSTGQVESISCDIVKENDVWSIQKSPEGDKYNFEPARKKRGEIDGFFAAVRLKSGACSVVYMTIDEVEEHRDAYSAMYKSKPQSSPWHKSFNGMALKTVVKTLFRNNQIPELQEISVIDDKEEVEFSKPPEKNVTAEIKEALIEKEIEPPPGEQENGDGKAF